MARRSSSGKGPLEKAANYAVENWQTLAVIGLAVFAFLTLKKYAGSIFGGLNTKYDANREAASRKITMPNTAENRAIYGAVVDGDSVVIEIPGIENIASNLAIALDYPGYWLRLVSKSQIASSAKELYRSQYVPFRIYFDAWAKNNPEFEREGIGNPRLEEAFSLAARAPEMLGTEPKQWFIQNMKNG